MMAFCVTVAALGFTVVLLVGFLQARAAARRVEAHRWLVETARGEIKDCIRITGPDEGVVEMLTKVAR